MKVDRRFIFLAKYGIVESNNEDGVYDVQRIDSPEEFALDNQLKFIPPLLKGDKQAKQIFKGLIK
jgi:hypothetical protein